MATINKQCTTWNIAKENMNYENAIEYLDTFDKNKIHLGLERVGELLEIMGNPQDGQRFIHVTGTNGKGSTISYLYNILLAAHCSVGAFTSPHLKKINESFRCDGVDISDDEFAEIVTEVAEKLEGCELQERLTKFEILTVIALIYFRRHDCAWTILEVGLGGLTDATNIIQGTRLAVFTKISIDHTNFMGNTVESIATIKSGIIKPNCQVIIAKQEYPDAYKVLRGEALRQNARVSEVECDYSDYSFDGAIQRFDYREYKGLEIAMLGRHQVDNAITAIEMVRFLVSCGEKISENDIRKGLIKARWQCRLELINRAPNIYVDGGHNLDGIESLVEFFRENYADKKIKLVFGVLSDKEYAKMIALLAPITAKVYAVKSNSYRALEPSEIAKMFHELGVDTYECSGVDDAVDTMLSESDSEDIVCVTGSLYYVGTAKDKIIERLRNK